jgi:hypothetical protein
MKAIIGDKLYDTEKAEKIFSFRRQVDKGPVVWNEKLHWTPYHTFDLYRTSKGAYFEHDAEDNTIHVTTQHAAKEVVRKLDPDKYMEVFCITVEEA